MKNSIVNLRQAGLAALTLLIFVGCTKPRDEKVADEVTENELMLISDLEAKGYSLQLGESEGILPSKTKEIQDKPVAVNEKPLFQVVKAQVPAKLQKAMTSNRAFVRGEPGQKLALRFEVYYSHLMAFQEVAEPKKLSVIDQQLLAAEKRSILAPPF